MSMHERTGTRDLTYSRWHRQSSIKRYLTARQAALLMMVDVDCVEYCAHCKDPLVIVETQRSSNTPKEASMCVNLGRRLDVPVYSVSYWSSEGSDDIDVFRIRQLWPYRMAPQQLTPREMAEWLWQWRATHEPQCSRLMAYA